MPRIKWPALSKAPSPGPRLARAAIPRLVTAPAPRPRLRGSLHSGEREGSLTHAFHHAMLKFGLQMQQDIYRMLYKCITSISWLLLTFWDSKLTHWLTDGLEVDSFRVLFVSKCHPVWLTPAQITNNASNVTVLTKSSISWFLKFIKWHEHKCFAIDVLLLSKKCSATGSINLVSDNAAETTTLLSFLEFAA